MNTITQTGKTLLDALAFANVNRLDEFHAQLHRVDRPADPLFKQDSDDALPPSPRVVLSNIQGAL
jgi:hypothetical protein